MKPLGFSFELIISLTATVCKFSIFGKDSVHFQVMDHAGLVGSSSCEVKIALVYGDTSFIDVRDGNQYRAIRIDQLWWIFKYFTNLKS